LENQFFRCGALCLPTIGAHKSDCKRKFHRIYENFNEVGPIEVPQEVKDNANSLEDKMKEGGEMPDTSTSSPTYALAGAALILFGGSILLYRRKNTA
jgi:LPXTG-motif cell wall-anchored protein